MNRHLQELQNKNDSQTNTTILSRRLCVCFACLCLCFLLSSFVVNAATTKTVTLRYEFDVNVVLDLKITVSFRSHLVCVSQCK